MSRLFKQSDIAQRIIMASKYYEENGNIRASDRMFSALVSLASWMEDWEQNGASPKLYQHPEQLEYVIQDALAKVRTRNNDFKIHGLTIDEDTIADIVRKTLERAVSSKEINQQDFAAYDPSPEKAMETNELGTRLRSHDNTMNGLQTNEFVYRADYAMKQMNKYVFDRVLADFRRENASEHANKFRNYLGQPPHDKPS